MYHNQKRVFERSQLDLIPLTHNNAVSFYESYFFVDYQIFATVSECNKLCKAIPMHPPTLIVKIVMFKVYLIARALEILKSESVQPMTMTTSSMSPFQNKKNMYISPVTKTNDNWQSYNSF